MISIEIDSFMADRFIADFPSHLDKGVEDFKETIGRKLELESKKMMRANVAGPSRARSRTGFLANNIGYFGGEVVAHAEYSKYVHGAPFHNSRMRRKENPFFNRAIESSETFIKREAEAMMRRLLN